MKGNIVTIRKTFHDITLKSPKFIRTKWFLAGIIIVMSLVSGFLYIDNNEPAVLLADGEPIAIVAGEAQVKEVLEKVKSDLEDKYGLAVTGFNKKLSYNKEMVEESHKSLNNSELAALLQDRLDWQAECWRISINGKDALYLSSEEEAQKTLEGIKQYYLPKDSSDLTVEQISFNEDIKIAHGYGPVNSFKTPEAAVEAMAKGLDKIIQHTVKSGDSLWLIARANDMTVAQLREINPELKGDFLKPGQKLNLVKSEPLLTVTSVVVATKEERIPYKTVYENDSAMWRGQQKVKQNGQYGEREVTYRITKANDTEVDRETLAEKILLEPVSRIVIQGTKMMVASRGDGGSGQLGWPLRGNITSMYGKRGREFHTGLDINGDKGDPIFAAEDGVVLFAGWQGSYGNLITIDHGNGLSTRYGHLSAINVSMGQQVTRGSIIGKCGSTGRSTGSHLHFEVRINGVHKNPLNFLER